jgi:hypothetical protein
VAHVKVEQILADLAAHLGERFAIEGEPTITDESFAIWIRGVGWKALVAGNPIQPGYDAVTMWQFPLDEHGARVRPGEMLVHRLDLRDGAGAWRAFGWHDDEWGELVSVR